MKIIKLFCLTLLSLAVLWLLMSSDTTPSRDKRFVIDTHHAFRNTWYQVANLTAKRLGFNISCYICSWIPHHSEEVPSLTAVPVTLNTTALKLNITGFNSTTDGTHILEVPTQYGAGTPEGYIWKCGHTFYLYLPKDWCGTCSLAQLQPSSYIITEDGAFTKPTELKKREFTPPQVYSPFSDDGGRKPLYNDAKGIFHTLFPMAGVASLIKRMNEVWWTLENITDIFAEMSDLLANDPEKQAMTMLMQHQFALDTLFASEGGLCRVIGEHCSTHIHMIIGLSSMTEFSDSLIS